MISKCWLNKIWKKRDNARGHDGMCLLAYRAFYSEYSKRNRTKGSFHISIVIGMLG